MQEDGRSGGLPDIPLTYAPPASKTHAHPGVISATFYVKVSP